MYGTGLVCLPQVRHRSGAQPSLQTLSAVVWALHRTQYIAGKSAYSAGLLLYCEILNWDRIMARIFIRVMAILMALLAAQSSNAGFLDDVVNKLGQHGSKSQRVANTLSSKPPEAPFVNLHVCEGEKCEFSNVEWTAKEDVVARNGYNRNENVNFKVARGERLLGLDSVVITHQVGMDRVVQPCLIGDGVKAIPGELVHSLYYEGEGYFAAIFRGKRIDIDGAFSPYAKCVQEIQPMKTAQWVLAQNINGSTGWVEAEKFHNPSHGGGEVPSSPWLKIKPGQKVFNIHLAQDRKIDFRGDISKTPVPNNPDYILVSPHQWKLMACNYLPAPSCKLWVYDFDNGYFNTIKVAENVQEGFVAVIDDKRGYALVLNSCYGSHSQASTLAYRIDLLTGENEPIYANKMKEYLICPDAATFSENPLGVYSFKADVRCSDNNKTLCENPTLATHDFSIRRDDIGSTVSIVNVATWEAREVAKQFTDIGWSNDTGHKHAETPQQHAIVAAAMNIHEASPQSIATGNAMIWQTDTEGGDGKRMRDAIQVVYDYWSRSGRPALPFVAPLPTSVQNEMRVRLRATYSQTEQSAFIAQITSVFNGTVPGTDNETLQYLGIRAQCKEFADRIVQAGGGKTHTYSEGKALAVNPEDIRPGMYAFKKDSSHAAIIIAVKWDANGQATDLRLAEANMGPGWTNPKGQVPWKRGVRTREVPVSEFFVVPTD